MRIRIVDGEILTFTCEDCKNKFTYTIGYGPICPTPELRQKRLQENPPICPKCGSKNVKRPLWGKIVDSIL